MRSFYTETIPPVGGEVELNAEESAHALRVLRLRPGARLRLLNGQGVRATAQILAEAEPRRHAPLRCRVETRERWTPPRRSLHLLIAPPRARVMAQVIRDATELGVWRVTPLLCEFSVARPEGTGSVLHWQAEAVAAMKQSGNPFRPELDQPVPFHQALARTPTAGGLYGAGDGTAGGTALAEALAAAVAPLPLWVGPEGGFSGTERSALEERGCRPLAIGSWTLRVETAATALVACILGAGGDDFRCRQSE